jgi:hypothetical protein
VTVEVLRMLLYTIMLSVKLPAHHSGVLSQVCHVAPYESYSNICFEAVGFTALITLVKIALWLSHCSINTAVCSVEGCACFRNTAAACKYAEALHTESHSSNSLQVFCSPECSA